MLWNKSRLTLSLKILWGNIWGNALPRHHKRRDRHGLESVAPRLSLVFFVTQSELLKPGSDIQHIWGRQSPRSPSPGTPAPWSERNRRTRGFSLMGHELAVMPEQCAPARVLSHCQDAYLRGVAARRAAHAGGPLAGIRPDIARSVRASPWSDRFGSGAFCIPPIYQSVRLWLMI